MIRNYFRHGQLVRSVELPTLSLPKRHRVRVTRRKGKPQFHTNIAR